jgi:hypothetical protein
MAISKDIADIFKSMNTTWSSRVFSLLVLAVVVFGYVRGNGSKKQDCTYYIEQNKQLVSALIEIKKDLQDGMTTSYNWDGGGLSFASYDSVPKRMNKQQIQMRITIRKIDSILYRIKQDSVKQKQSL